MNLRFDRCADAFRAGLSSMVEAQLKDLKDRALADGEAFLAACREQTILWTGQLANGEITTGDFNWNMKSLADLAKMEFLRQAGLAEARRQAFRQRLVALLTASALKMIDA